MENLSLDEQIEKNKKLKKIEEAKFASSISESEQKLINAVHEKKSKEEILKLEEDIQSITKQKEESLANLVKSEKILQDQRKAADERKAEADKLEKLRLEVKADSESGEREEAEKWDSRRKSTMEALTDPKAFMISFLKKQALDRLEYAISKKKRMDVAKEDEEKVEKKEKSDNEMLARENEYRNAIMDRNEIQSIPTEDRNEIQSIPTEDRNEIQSIPTEDRNEIPNSDVMDEISVSLGSDDKLDSIINLMEVSNQIQSKQLRQDSDQWKADQRVSASEEAAGSGDKKIGISGLLAPDKKDEDEKEKPGILDGVISSLGDMVTEGIGGAIMMKMGLSSIGGGKDGKDGKGKKGKGLKGIIGNIMKKFGKAGKFLMSLGSKFLMPLLTTPVGWGILAGLAVGGLVFAYWDDIMSVVSNIFGKVKGFFSSVGESISNGIKAVVDFISGIIDFFNPLNLYPMIARALLPDWLYDPISSFFGGDTKEQHKDKQKRSEAKEKAEVTKKDSDDALADFTESDDEYVEKQLALSQVEDATAIGIMSDGSRIIIKKTRNGVDDVVGAEDSLRERGARLATPEEINEMTRPLQHDVRMAEDDRTIRKDIAVAASVKHSNAVIDFLHADKKVIDNEAEKAENGIMSKITAIGDVISDTVDFFKPANLGPMIAKAVMPSWMYDGISSFFTGKSTTENKSDKKKEELSTLNEEGDEMEAELNTMKSDQKDLGRSLKPGTGVVAYYDKDGEVRTIGVGDKFMGRRINGRDHARHVLRKAGLKVLDPVETNSLMNKNELKILSKENELDENTQQGEMVMDEIDTLDLKAKSEKKDDKPGNVVADLVRSGVIDWNVWGDSKVLDWEKLKSMDVINLKKVLDFNDWSDDTNSDLLNLITSKSPKVELDLPPVKPNEQNQKRKSDVMNQALQQGMDNRISGTQGQNGGSSGSQTNISAPTVNNNTTIKKEATHDTDVTARGLNKSAMMSLDDEF